jgi:hypothetical protein
MRVRGGVITGYVFKLARQSAGISQETLAAVLGVDPGTLQGWETARRPFTAVQVGRAVAIRSQMQRAGADPSLLAVLDDAAEADYLLGAIVAGGTGTVDTSRHPLGHLVLTHRLADLVSWAITGAAPAGLADRAGRRGPVPPGPQLDSAERTAFFAALQAAAEQTAGRDDAVLLHRQACYLAGMDPALSSWLACMTVSSGYFVKSQQWSPQWAAARSVATGLARQGNPEPLRAFIAHSIDTSTELAALNYSAYWVGEFGKRQTGDGFMPDPSARWRGTGLLRHIVDRMTPDHGFLDLNIHTLWSLLLARRGIVHDDPAASTALYRRGTELLDHGDVMSDQSRQELTSILYGVRADGVSS